MMYDEETKNMICDGIKNETRRIYNPARRPAIPGTRHKIKIDRTKKVYGEIDIISCEPQRWGDLTEEDARNEGFPNKVSYIDYFYQVNGIHQEDELIWVVKFKTVWTNKKGVIL